jgi:signal transduction histidine kinase
MPSKSRPKNAIPESEAQVARLKRRVAALEALQEMTQTLTSELPPDRLLALILSNAVDVMQATAGSLLLLDPATDELVFQVVQGGGGKALHLKRIRTDEGIAGWAFTHCQPVIAQDVGADPRHLSRIDERVGFHTSSLLAAPLILKGKPIGVIEVLNKASGERFDEDEQELLMAFAAQSAAVIENTRLYHQVVAERDRIVAVEDEVRRELARGLHDGPAQLLSAITMGLRFVREVIARQPERTEKELLDLERMATRAIHQVRDMLFDLRPVVLETRGLCAALEMYAERQREPNGLPLRLDLHSFTARFPPKVEGAVFSIVQEAVGNARKHAQAKNIWITARQSEDALTISVQDDGTGFDVARIEATYDQRNSLGLLNMRERAEIANAQLSIASKIGAGTLVTLVLPLSLATRR